MIDAMESHQRDKQCTSSLQDRFAVRSGATLRNLREIVDYDFIYNYIIEAARDNEGWYGDGPFTRARYCLGLLIKLIRDLTNVNYGIFVHVTFKVLPAAFPAKLQYLGQQLVELLHKPEHYEQYDTKKGNDTKRKAALNDLRRLF